jgi:hypothetical protein
VIAVVFQVGAALLLVNMLIAQMAKTFDAVWESQDLNFMYLRARTTLAWDGASASSLCFLTVALHTATLPTTSTHFHSPDLPHSSPIINPAAQMHLLWVRR